MMMLFFVVAVNCFRICLHFEILYPFQELNCFPILHSSSLLDEWHRSNKQNWIFHVPQSEQQEEQQKQLPTRHKRGIEERRTREWHKLIYQDNPSENDTESDRYSTTKRRIRWRIYYNSNSWFCPIHLPLFSHFPPNNWNCSVTMWPFTCCK